MTDDARNEPGDPRDDPGEERPADTPEEGSTRTDGGTTGERVDSAPGSDARWEVSEGGAVLTTGDTTVIARTSARVVVPIILLLSVSLLFQGHNLPGGGFIGGVLTAAAFALVYIVYGLDFIEEAIAGRRIEHGRSDDERYGGVSRVVFSVGLALAVGSGLVPVLLDLALFTQAAFLLEGLPLYGEFEVASAFAFDLGVFLVVVGGLLTILREVGEE